jgi:hypothetical protein
VLKVVTQNYRDFTEVINPYMHIMSIHAEMYWPQGITTHTYARMVTVLPSHNYAQMYKFITSPMPNMNLLKHNHNPPQPYGSETLSSRFIHQSSLSHQSGEGEYDL